MKARWIVALALALWMFGAAPAALGFYDALPAVVVQETGPHDGDPDDPTAFTASGVVAFEEQEGTGEKSETTSGWTLWTMILLWPVGIAR